MFMMKIHFFCAQPTFSWKITVKKGERRESMWAHTHACTHARVIIDTTWVTKDKQWPIRLQPWPWSFQLHTRAGLDKPPGFMHCLPCMCPLCNLKLWKHKQWTGTRISNHSKQIQEQFKVQMCCLYQVANFHKNLETKKQRGFFFITVVCFYLIFFPQLQWCLVTIKISRLITCGTLLLFCTYSMGGIKLNIKHWM